MRLNVGCGQTPTSGWNNFDNSFSLRLARWPRLSTLAGRLGLLEPTQVAFVEFAGREHVEWADACRLPCADGSVDALYTSHMLEHLDQAEAQRFLAEALRVLCPGGILRIAVPDLGRMVAAYVDSGDADAFIAATLMAVPKPKTFAQRLRLAIVGPRHHHWLYDCQSLCKLLTTNGFSGAVGWDAGTTGIPDPGALDLREHESETLYVEATKPPVV